MKSTSKQRARWRRYYRDKKKKDREDLKETLMALNQPEDFK